MPASEERMLAMAEKHAARTVAVVRADERRRCEKLLDEAIKRNEVHSSDAGWVVPTSSIDDILEVAP
jgi:hypothetical protein